MSGNGAGVPFGFERRDDLGARLALVLPAGGHADRAEIVIRQRVAVERRPRAAD